MAGNNRQSRKGKKSSSEKDKTIYRFRGRTRHKMTARAGQGKKSLSEKDKAGDHRHRQSRARQEINFGAGQGKKSS
jgi:hypothetical protein